MVKIEMSEAEVKEPSDSESQLNSPLEKFRSSASTKDAETGYFSTDELSARIRNELDPDNQRSSRASNYLVSPVVSGKEAPESCDGNVDNNGENDEADEEKEKNENEPEVRPGSVQSVPEESSEYLRSILDNFNSLYMEKLKMLDDLVEKGDEDQKLHLMEKKADMLENWAKDVCVHNLVLVHTVEELEKEANRKVVALQKKIMESTQVAKEHMTMIKKYEQQVKLLLKNHSEAEEKNLVLQIELKKLKSECKRVRDRMNSLLNDHENLITLVCRIRDMGVWDVDGLELQRSSFDQIFGLYPSLVGQEVQSVFTTEKAKCAQQAEEKLERLQKKLDDLKETTKDADSFIVLKDRKIEELETEITNLSNKVHYCEEECNDYKKSLLETQEKLLKATKELTRQSRAEKSESRSEMSELLRELRVVKSQLNTAVEEKQNAREETNYFKKELSDRLKEVQDIQHFMQSLATEVVSSRQALQQVQEKEVQLQTLKTEVQTYQTRCADADDTIRKKEKEIVKLQKQMNEIHQRMFDLDDEWEKVIGSMGSKSAGSGPTGRDNKIDKSSVLDENQSQNQTEIFFSDETQRDPDSTTPRTMEFLTRQHHQEPPFPSVSPDTPRSLNSSTATTATEPPSKPDSLLLQQLLEALALEKRQMEEHFQKVLLDKDIELKMQKVTIQHLQDAYVALKRGQPIPVPQNVTGNKIVPISNVATPPAANGQGLHNHNNNNNNNHKKHHNQVLDV